MSIAAYITDDLRARIQSGHKFQGDLTLESLAKYYQVSFTPVRTAVATLVADGILTRREDRRLAPAKGQVVAASPECSAPVPKRPPDWLEIVRADLVRQSLSGEAAYVREESMAREYGISRTTITKIFHRLAGIGLLTHIPRRGWQLRPFRQKDMKAFLEAREALELKALELAAPYLVEADLQAMLDGNGVPVSVDAATQVDNSLHAYIITKADNSYIADFFERHGAYYEILFEWEGIDREAEIEAARQHREILEALIKRDWPAAHNALSRHIRYNHPVLNRIGPRESDTNGNPARGASPHE